MSPPFTYPHPDFGFPNTNIPSSQNLGKFEFVCGFGGGKSNLSDRPRPRLTKLRRKETMRSKDGNYVKTGPLPSSNGDTFISYAMSGSNSDAKKATERFVFAFGDNCGSKLGEGNVDESSVTGSRNATSIANQNLPAEAPVPSSSGAGLPVHANLKSRQFTFAIGKSDSGRDTNFGVKNSGRLKAHTKVNGFKKSDSVDSVDSVLDSHKCGSNIRLPLNQQDPRKPCSQQNGFKKSDTIDNVFDSHERDSNVRLPLNQQDSCKPCSQLNEFKKSDSIDSVFDSHKSGSNIRVPLNQQDSCKPCSQLNVDNFQEVNAEFVFGARANVLSSTSSGEPKQASDNNMERVGSNKDAENNVHDGWVGAKLETSRVSEKTTINSSDVSGVCSAFDLRDAMKKLNINGLEAKTKKTESLNSDFSEGAFVFGKDNKNSCLEKENQNMNKKFPNVSHYSEINYEQSRNSSWSMFSSFGSGTQPVEGFCEVPCVDKDEKHSTSFTKKPDGSLDASCGTPNTAFACPFYNFFPGADNANSKSLKGNRSKKKPGKWKQQTVVPLQNLKSPGCGSPMDFSPYKNTDACGETKADMSSGVKGVFTVNKKYASEDMEKSEDENNDSYFSPPFPSQDGLSAIRDKYQKKYKLKVGLNHTSQGNNCDEGTATQDPASKTAHEVCEYWRIKGNQAYHDGILAKAEEFYSTGINAASHLSARGYSLKPLLLCYSNRAATRMSLGRMREAIGDCTKAAELDPDFLKVTLRAGNCYLVLGEVEDAIQCYSKCLSSGAGVCLDRRIVIEAADCLQKAKKVAEHIDQSAKFVHEGNSNSTNTALKNIDEALSISRFSERLLQMKGEALCSLRIYDEVIRLCDQTLDIAKKNFGADCSNDKNRKCCDVNFWRLHLQSKSYFHLGQLDFALELIEKQEKMPGNSMSGDMDRESSIALATTLRELLSLKKSGNEAFNSGQYTKAVENYTSAISKSSGSRPFMAICFCNRAAAYQSINQIVDAIADCSLAIALDENYRKAISRRATLHEMIRDYKQAVCDLQRLVSLLESQSQKNKQSSSLGKSSGGSVRDIRKARRHLNAVEEKAAKEISLDFYLILGIKATGTEAEIKKAYRKAALRHHPDKVLGRSGVGDDNGALWKDLGEKIHEDADRLFKVIGEAYAVLSDPSKRSKHDDEEERRNTQRDSSINSKSGYPPTSYSSPFESEYWHRNRTSSSNASSERNSNWRHSYESRSNSYSRPRW